MDPLKELMDSLAKLEFGGMSAEEKDEDITKQLSGHYLAIIQHTVTAFEEVTLFADDLTKIQIDGNLYSLSSLAAADDPHRVEIETILSELLSDGEDAEEILTAVQTHINAKKSA